MSRLRVVVADDERPARAFLVSLLNRYDDVEVVGEAVNATTRLPLARRPVKNRVGVRALNMVPFIVPPRPQYRRTITSDRGEKAAGTAAPPLGAFFVTAFPLTMV